MHNAVVTRYVTGAVTLPRPDPTRPDPELLAEGPIHLPVVGGSASWMAADAATIGGQR